MIGIWKEKDDSLEAIPPSDSSNNDEERCRADADGSPPSASTSASAPPHPYAPIFDMAIDGIATMAAGFVRERLNRIVYPHAPVAEALVEDVEVDDIPAAQSERPLTSTDSSSSKKSDQCMHVLVAAVAISALAAGILWYVRAQEKRTEA